MMFWTVDGLCRAMAEHPITAHVADSKHRAARMIALRALGFISVQITRFPHPPARGSWVSPNATCSLGTSTLQVVHHHPHTLDGCSVLNSGQ